MKTIYALSIWLAAFAFSAISVAWSQETRAMQRAESACGIVYCANGSQGTGFFVGANGEFLTNYHVIEGAKAAYVKLRDGSKHKVLYVANFSARPDIALLVVDVKPTSVMEIAEPEETQIGMKIITIGGPHGIGWFRTEGVIEGIREMRGTEALQHTAKIEPGNSGGPAFDSNGKVHAINTWVRAREVLKASGGYTIDWSAPQYLGISSRIIKKFLSLPRSRISMATLAQYYAESEIAAFMLVACNYSDIILRELHADISDMEVTKRIYYNPYYRNVSGKYPAITKNYWQNANNFVLSATETKLLRDFVFTQFPVQTSDNNLRNAINQWKTCLERVDNAINAILDSQGKSSRKMDTAIDKVIHEFTQANDAYYYTLTSSMNAYRTYFKYSTESLPVSVDLLKELNSFYYNRGLTFKKK